MKESMSQDEHDAHDAVDCRSAMDRLFEMLDGELTPERERQVRAHIVGCPGCFAHADFEERFLKAVRAARLSGASASLRERVLSSLRAQGWTG